MKYNCVVCVKQVPDTKRITGDAMTEEGTVNRGALPAVFNPEDLNALEQALWIRDEYGGTVTVLTMGPPTACEVLREGLYRGADQVVLITDRAAAASDTLATSYILSCAVTKFSPDIVLCGRQAIDGDTAQVGPQLAQKLTFPVISYLEELVGLDDGKITVRRNIGNGWEVVSSKLPVLLTVTGSANIPRPPGARRMMKYKKARSAAELTGQVADEMPDASQQEKATEVKKRCEALKGRGLLLEQWSLDDIEADLAWCGRDGSPTKVHRVQSIVLAGGEYREFPPTDEGIAELVGDLIEDHTIG
ncbi:MAG: electron transfer flavoprotein subunit beta/FixA family protein [Phycisphaerae bacterium]|nr:electron transfer flavoprotein subunit beta/FixA family protein [Phycisphaerae bacterium]